jgi:flagellar P-ring protein precursor FlgI
MKDFSMLRNRRIPWDALLFLLAAGLLLILVQSAHSAGVRIKDIAYAESERGNPLMGYGLLVGLNGTGDDSTKKETAQAIQSYFSMLSPESRGLAINLVKAEPKNSALVLVTADLPPYTRAGSELDITVSSQFDATSLSGGTLITTPLYGLDGKIYAMAQGPVLVGGFAQTGAAGGGGGQQKNHPTVGVITAGAIVERNANILREFDRMRIHSGELNLILRNPDFTQAINIQKAINKSFKLAPVAEALDPGTVTVNLKALMERYQYDSSLELMREIEQIEVETDMPARVIVSERTGLIISGGDASLSAVDIVHGDLRIMVSPAEADKMVGTYGIAGVTETGGYVRPGYSQELIKGKGSVSTVEEQDPTVVALKEGDSVGNLIQAVSGSLGKRTPRDIIAILQALDRMGALHAKLMFVED